LGSATDSVSAVQSGTWNITNISGTISLPTGAATSANQSSEITQLTNISSAQTNATQKTQIVDGSGNVISSSGNALNVNGVSNIAPADLVASGTITGLSSTVVLTTNAVGAVNIDVGGTFSATLTVQGNMPYDGQQIYVQNIAINAFATSITSGGVYRVVGAQAYSAITVLCTSYTSGTANVAIRASVSSNPFTQAYQLKASNLLTSSWLSDGSGNALSSSSGALNVAQSGTWNITNISGTISLPTGAATSANQSSEITQLTNISSAQTNATQKTQIVDGSGNVIASNNNSLNVNTKTNLTVNTPGTVNVGTTSASFLAANSSRKGLIIVNTSANIVSFGFGATAVLNSGMTLFPGGVFQMDENTFSTAAINSIAGAASSAVAYQEFQ
jgi:hypothetical protein